MKITRTADIEFRFDGEEKESRTVEGIACVFNQATDLGWFTEEIDRNAFEGCDFSDVVLNFNHDNSLILARTTNGSLTLYTDEKGLHQRAEIVKTSTGEDVLTLVRNKLISKMSFAFTIANDGEEWVERDGEKDHRIIKKIGRLYDVSLVTFPAYEQTSVSARSEDELAKERRDYLDKLQEQKEKMERLINGKSM